MNKILCCNRLKLFPWIQIGTLVRLKVFNFINSHYLCGWGRGLTPFNYAHGESGLPISRGEGWLFSFRLFPVCLLLTIPSSISPFTFTPSPELVIFPFRLQWKIIIFLRCKLWKKSLKYSCDIQLLIFYSQNALLILFQLDVMGIV